MITLNFYETVKDIFGRVTFTINSLQKFPGMRVHLIQGTYPRLQYQHLQNKEPRLFLVVPSRLMKSMAKFMSKRCNASQGATPRIAELKEGRKGRQASVALVIDY